MAKLGEFELNHIYTGDARELARGIPDESVDLIFTDPMYENIDDYKWLAQEAARVLKPTGAVLAWVATQYLPDVLRVMVPPLSWAWMLYWHRYGKCYPSKSGICVITCCLWLDKGNSRTSIKIADCIGAATLVNVKNIHYWSKPEKVIRAWVDSFSHKDAIVVDYFSGSGTVPYICQQLQRQWLAFEIDSSTADDARKRVASYQMAMPLSRLCDSTQQLDLGLIDEDTPAAQTGSPSLNPPSGAEQEG